jgi:hypothetical protein
MPALEAVDSFICSRARFLEGIIGFPSPRSKCAGGWMQQEAVDDCHPESGGGRTRDLTLVVNVFTLPLREARSIGVEQRGSWLG